MMRLRWRIENWYVCGVCKDSIGEELDYYIWWSVDGIAVDCI